jgi:hypothetical protein
MLKSSYNEDEICNQLDNMIAGGSWVKFETTEKIGKKKEKKIIKLYKKYIKFFIQI